VFALAGGAATSAGVRPGWSRLPLVVVDLVATVAVRAAGLAVPAW